VQADRAEGGQRQEAAEASTREHAVGRVPCVSEC
jgi:hypothetical protein